MRYILDDRGYVKYCSNTYITCENKTCTSYEGTIPNGYETIEEWVQKANIRAYKIVDGNLTYDSDEDARLQEEYKKSSYTYSTEEKVIGTWIDGKPIYRKVIAVNQSISNMSEIYLHLLNIETLIKIKSFQTRDSETRYTYDQFYDSSGRKFSPQYMGNKILFWTGTGETYVATIWIEYTKTTD